MAKSETAVNPMFGCRFHALGILFLLCAAPAAAAPAEYGRDANPFLCSELSERVRQGERGLNERRIDLLLFEAAGKGCVSVVAELLERGASLEARNRFAETPLMKAAEGGHPPIVRLLLDRGAAIDVRNLEGATALTKAVAANRARVARLLLDRGAAVAVASGAATPLAIAAFNGSDDLVRLLLERGADPNATDRTGKGPIVYAAAKGFASIVALLIDAGADPDARYAHDLTALMWAAGHANDVPAQEGLETVALLHRRGASLDLADDRGRTALMIAAERGHASIVGWLLDNGADPDVRDRNGARALDLAAGEAVRAALAGRPAAQSEAR